MKFLVKIDKSMRAVRINCEFSLPRLSTFSRGNLKSAGLANACRTTENSSYYGSAFVQKWPQKQPQSSLISKNFLGEHPPRSPSSCLLVCLYTHTYTLDIDVTPLQKILATGLTTVGFSARLQVWTSLHLPQRRQELPVFTIMSQQVSHQSQLCEAANF